MKQNFPKLSVLIIGPEPGAQGGVGVLMGHLRDSGSSSSSLRFLNPGSSGARRGAAFVSAVYQIVASRRSVDLVHFNVASRGSTFRKILLSLVVRACRIPYVIHLHGAGYRQFVERLAPWQFGFVVKFFASAQRVLVLGEGWRDYVANTIGVDKMSIDVVPNAVPGPDKVVDSVRDECYMVFSGRLSERKGVRELLAALPKISPKLPWRLGLAGDFDDSIPADELRQLSQDPRFNLLGWLSQDELGRELDRASIYVLPSHAEGLPLGLLDAMAHSCVPVVTPVGAIPEVVINDHNGILVPVGSADALSVQLERLLGDPSKVQRIRMQARKTWEESYSMKNYRSHLDDVYRKCDRRL
ncbi:glycosyltransferase family 4 protein [Paeniglutamicibacter sp. ORCA_105]|uniref:glycosyltransferase family 4 protein n=1 Tax=Paeniglutamicibacter sp. ORCA_105 TaxID=3377336 RepID=UPI00389685AE